MLSAKLGNLWTPILKSFWFASTWSQPACIAAEADALPTQPSKLSQYAEVQQYL